MGGPLDGAHFLEHNKEADAWAEKETRVLTDMWEDEPGSSGPM